MAQDFKIDWTPGPIELGNYFWLVSRVDQPITSLTIRHTTKPGGDQVFDVSNWSILTTVSFPNLLHFTGPIFFTIANCPALTTISMPVFVPADGQEFDFSGNALTATAINAFLARCVASSAYVSGSIDVSGGTSDAPDGQGQTYINDLQSRSPGVFVITN